MMITIINNRSLFMNKYEPSVYALHTGQHTEIIMEIIVR